MPSSPSDLTTPEDVEESLQSAKRDEIASERPDEEQRQQILDEHRHHLVRRTTSQVTEEEEIEPGMIAETTAEVEDIYCFDCEAWIGISGVDLRGTPRSRADAYYLGGPPDAVVEAREDVGDTLADLAYRVMRDVPTVEDADDALDWIEGELEQARDRVEVA